MMRVVFYGILLAVLPLAELAAQTAPPSRAELAQLPPALQNLQRELNISPADKGPPKPTEELDASFFFPKNLLVDASTVLSPETRTPAQLEALLSSYVGTWRGESVWYAVATQRSFRAPTETVYKLEKENGHNLLTCTITYLFNNKPSVAFSRLWVENGHIFSEVTQSGQRQKYVAQTRESGLAWSIYGSMDAVLDFAETETLRLTVDGDRISSRGFELQHTAEGASLVLETTELKLVK